MSLSKRMSDVQGIHPTKTTGPLQILYIASAARPAIIRETRKAQDAHKNDKKFSPLIDQPKTWAPSTGQSLLRNWRQRSGRGRHLYQGVKVLTNTKGPLAKGSGAPATPAAALMRDLADGLGGQQAVSGRCTAGARAETVLSPCWRRAFTPDVANVSTESMFKQILVNIVIGAWCTVNTSRASICSCMIK